MDYSGTPSRTNMNLICFAVPYKKVWCIGLLSENYPQALQIPHKDRVNAAAGLEKLNSITTVRKGKNGRSGFIKLKASLTDFQLVCIFASRSHLINVWEPITRISRGAFKNLSQVHLRAYLDSLSFHCFHQLILMSYYKLLQTLPLVSIAACHAG